MISDIQVFVSAISKPILPKVFNPWSQTCSTELVNNGWKGRRERLINHLNCPMAKMVLIGEASGYQGCRFSGIAFTSERLLMENSIPRVSMDQGARITTRNIPWSEPSATIVWKALYEYGLSESTIMFNAVPWHPEGNKGALSNRTPSRFEKSMGIEYLEMLLKIFSGIKVIAVGNTASINLEAMNVTHSKVRHPANGGANLFRKGLSEISV